MGDFNLLKIRFKKTSFYRFLRFQTNVLYCSWFVRAMEMELEQEDEHVKIESLSPYQVKQLLLSILVHRSDEYDLRTPMQRRQLDGALSRVPKDFYERVWEILERTPGGIKVAGYLLPQVR